MKTYKNLYNQICSFENLEKAYKQAKKGKRYRNDVLRFSEHLEQNLIDLQMDLINQTYKHGEYRQFIVADAKKRLIKAAPFRDRVVHHAICNIIEPIFDKSFIYHSYACRKGKGTHSAVKVVQNRIKNMGVGGYCLQCDISKYFASIDHVILMSFLKNKITDSKTINLLNIVVASNYDDKNGRKVGIPIGNLTSQLFANIYLNKLDQFIKHELKEKNYTRYMDDFVIFSFSKKRLFEIKESIKNFIEKTLNLLLHPRKAIVFPTYLLGVDFLGYRIFSRHILLRKSTVKRFLKRYKVLDFEIFKKGIEPWLAYAKHANSWGLRSQLAINYQIDGIN